MKYLIILLALISSVHAQSVVRLLTEKELVSLRRKATISLIAYKNEKFYNEGTAFYLGDNGYILTAYHLMYDLITSPNNHSVKLFDYFKKEIKFEVIACSNSTFMDLCLLKAQTPSKYFFPLTPIEVGTGHPLFSIGACELGSRTLQKSTFVKHWTSWQDEVGLSKHVTKGMAFLNRNTKLVEHSGDQCQGSSGGPLFDSRGNLVGLLSVIYRMKIPDSDKEREFKMGISMDEMIKYYNDYKDKAVPSIEELSKNAPRAPSGS